MLPAKEKLVTLYERTCFERFGSLLRKRQFYAHQCLGIFAIFQLVAQNRPHCTVFSFFFVASFCASCAIFDPLFRVILAQLQDVIFVSYLGVYSFRTECSPMSAISMHFPYSKTHTNVHTPYTRLSDAKAFVRLRCNFFHCDSVPFRK